MEERGAMKTHMTKKFLAKQNCESAALSMFMWNFSLFPKQ